MLAVFRLKYDCHNIKTLIKARGADVSALLLDAGSISILESEKGVPSIRTWNWRPDLAH